MAQGGGTVALDQSDQQLALCGLQAAGVPARQPGALFEHELHRARSRDREGHGTLVRRGARAARSRPARSLSGRSCRRRAASLISTTLATTRTFRGRRARSSRTRTTSPLPPPSSSAGSLQRLPRDDEDDGRWHRSSASSRPTTLPADAPGVTTVTSSTTRRSSARARRATASPSSRSAGPDTYRGSGERYSARSLPWPRALRQQSRGSRSSALLAPARRRSTS